MLQASKIPEDHKRSQRTLLLQVTSNMATTSITLPDTFGYVILSCVIAPSVVVSLMGGVSQSE